MNNIFSNFFNPSLALAFIFLIANGAQAQDQMISAKANMVNAGDKAVEIEIIYSVSENVSATGIGVDIYYDASKLLLQSISEAENVPNFLAKSGELADIDNRDSDATTNKFVKIGYASLEAVDWPGAEVLSGANGNLVIATVTFDIANDAAEGTTDINFVTSAVSAGFSFKAESSSITIASAVTAETDSDGDGLPDEWESQYGLDPNSVDANQDSDGDGLSNLEEYQQDKILAWMMYPRS